MEGKAREESRRWGSDQDPGKDGREDADSKVMQGGDRAVEGEVDI